MTHQPLPNNPDLDKLRGVAKFVRDLARTGEIGAVDLLRAHHPRFDSLDPSRLKLSDAQLVVARQHGFASWARLKHHVEIVRPLARSPHEEPAHESGPDELLRLGCLTYGDDHPSRLAAARAMLEADPSLSGASIHTMAACGATEAAEVSLGRDRSLANRPGGPFALPPLLYAAYSRIPGVDTLPVARVLLAGGADPNAGFLWMGAPPPFTALTGAFGGGEGNQPAHPRSSEFAEMLLRAGADANDGQAVYNRGLGQLPHDDTEWLELLLRHGFGLGDGGPWKRLLGDQLHTPRQLLGEALQHAAEAGLPRRVRLLLDHGADPNGSGQHRVFRGRTAYQGAVLHGHVEIATMLEEAGADLGSVDAGSRTIGALLAGDARVSADEAARIRAEHPALMVRAAELGRAGACRLLHRLGFDVNAAMRATALHEAAWRGDDDIVRVLLELGADPTIEDTEFRATAAGWAEHGGHRSTAALLHAAATSRAGG